MISNEIKNTARLDSLDKDNVVEKDKFEIINKIKRPNIKKLDDKSGDSFFKPKNLKERREDTRREDENYDPDRLIPSPSSVSNDAETEVIDVNAPNTTESRRTELSEDDFKDIVKTKIERYSGKNAIVNTPIPKKSEGKQVESNVGSEDN